MGYLTHQNAKLRKGGGKKRFKRFKNLETLVVLFSHKQDLTK